MCLKLTTKSLITGCTKPLSSLAAEPACLQTFYLMLVLQSYGQSIMSRNPTIRKKERIMEDGEFRLGVMIDKQERLYFPCELSQQGIQRVEECNLIYINHYFEINQGTGHFCLLSRLMFAFCRDRNQSNLSPFYSSELPVLLLRREDQCFLGANTEMRCTNHLSSQMYICPL